MPQEIERKFILSKIPKDLPALKIKQGYLQLDKNCTIRVRSTISSSGTENTLTIKGLTSTSGMSRYEYETELSKMIPSIYLKFVTNLLLKKLDTYISIEI